MQGFSGRLHHVVGLVRPENLEATVARLREVLGGRFYPTVERPQYGIKMAISLDAGIELIAPSSMATDHPLAQTLKVRGEHWMSVVMATDDLEAAVARLEKLGSAIVDRRSLMDIPQPFAERISRFDLATAEPAAFGGLPVILAEVEYCA